MRTINLHLTDLPDTDVREVRVAIGYLSFWAFPSFPVVDIHPDGDTDFFAVYSDPAHPDRRYVIGAVWYGDESRYSFHS
jgi:hypothetical protein